MADVSDLTKTAAKTVQKNPTGLAAAGAALVALPYAAQGVAIHESVGSVIGQVAEVNVGAWVLPSSVTSGVLFASGSEVVSLVTMSPHVCSSILSVAPVFCLNVVVR